MNIQFRTYANSLNKSSIIILILSLIFHSGCERNESWESFDCSNCFQDKPEWGPLKIKVTINNENPSVPIVIYRGDIESNDIEYTDKADHSDYTVDVPPDKYYSVTAEYKTGGKTIFVVDGDKLKVKKNVKDCDQECYYFKGGYFDVRLRE